MTGKRMGIHTTGDNLAAKSLYEKCGYTVTEHKENVNNDGTVMKNYSFEKQFDANLPEL